MRATLGEGFLIQRAQREMDDRRKAAFGPGGKMPAGWVFSDVRSEAEARFVRELGGAVLHLRRFGLPRVNPHHTEAGVVFVPGDIAVPNEGKLSELERRIAEIVFHLAARMAG